MVCIICFCSCFSVMGCNKDNIENSESNLKHSIKQTETNDYLIKDGTCDYVIVYSENDMCERLDFSLSELVFFIKEATGITLSTVKDNGLSYNEQSKYISLGNTTLLSQSGIVLDKELLGTQGVRILTRGKSIFLCGLTEHAIMNSVYKFLSIAFNYDHFVFDYYIDTNVTDLKLMNYDVTEVPDMTYRAPGQDQLYKSNVLTRRLGFADTESSFRMITQNEEEGWTGKTSTHNGFCFAPPTKFLNEKEYPEYYHPKWYSNDATQFCYTTHGDADEYKALLEQCFKVAKQNLIRDTVSTLMPFNHMDKVTSCDCSSCIEAKEHYGAESGAYIKFTNDLYYKITEWFDTEEGKPYSRDLVIIILAYNNYVGSPVKYNESTKTNEATIKTAEGVSVIFAPINMDWNRSLDSEANQSYYDFFLGWEKVCSHLSLYTYTTNYCNFYAPFSVFDVIQRNYQIMAKNGAVWTISLGCGESKSPTNWQTLLAYLESKLQWNINVDYDYYVKKFFKMAYGSASDTMYQIFNEYRLRVNLSLQNRFSGKVYLIQPYYSGDYQFWPKQTLLRWMDLYDYAFEQIATLKEKDQVEYNTIYRRIIQERLSPLYILCDYYANEFSTEELNSYRQLFKQDAFTTGVSLLSSHPNGYTFLSTKYTEWGI